MVELTNPDPGTPIQGERFEITAADGRPPYEFSWWVGEGSKTTETQNDPTFEFLVPEGTTGEVLHVEVIDGSQDSDEFEKMIAVHGGGT